MELWNTWLALVNPFEGACNRKKTFFWLVIVLIGFTIKFDSLGVTSIARGAGITSMYYTSMLNFFNSTAVNLEILQSIWIRIVFSKFGSSLVLINGRYIIAGDGIKIGKEGKKMPGVKWLHQESESNSKAEYIMGHSIQALSILAKGLNTYFAIPLAGQIHEGVRLTYKDRRTLLDKIFELLISLGISEACYLVLDKYYCSGRFMRQLVSKNIHIVTMMKHGAVAYGLPDAQQSKRRGKPRKYGEKIKLFDLFNINLPFIKIPLPGSNNLMIEYCKMEFFWRPFGGMAQFVFTRHPTRGNAIAMSTDLTLAPADMIFIYGLRFKIEVMFKQAVHTVGVFLYRFWLKMMKPIVRGSGDQNLQFASRKFKENVARKLRSYHLFMLLGFIAQGLLQYLSIYYHEIVWKNFGTWLRTIRKNILPSEMVVALAMKNTYFEFLIDGEYCSIFKKFLLKKIDIRRLRYLIPTKAEAA
jgi:DDE superfamily endonuclease